MNEKRILIIDDDEEICNELKEILEDEGYIVNYKMDGLTGFKEIKDGNYDLVIQDLKLPGMNGLDLLVKTKEYNSNQKVIVLTGRPLNTALLNENNDIKNEEYLLFSKADRIFNKPFNVFEILKNIEELFK